MYYKLGRAGRALDRFGVIEFATTIAPGVRDVLLTGKVYEATKRNARNKGAIEYDAVVLDAPPTGRITQFLGVNSELAGLAKVGPIKTPVRQRDAAAALRPDRGAPGHRAGGDARPGDGRRDRRPAGPRPPGRRRGGQHGPPAATSTPTRWRRARRHGRRGAVAADLKAAGLEADDDARRRAARRGARPRRAPGARGRAAQGGRRPRRADVRAAPADRRHRPRRALRARRRCSASRGWPDGAQARVPRRAASDGGRPRLDVDALLDDPVGIIVCCGSGGVGKTTIVRRAGAARRRARPQASSC